MEGTQSMPLCRIWWDKKKQGESDGPGNDIISETLYDIYILQKLYIPPLLYLEISQLL